ncbi:TetR/AcrR family transcriptional regulator [Dactylosporangium sp. CA-139066]|uniref:TetR/AcrR family transcriptional regulator n=1 Tax=Dactylosporangium sp. CA-139066 TaxID=3239930 RepID=UPI003D94063E
MIRPECGDVTQEPGQARERLLAAAVDYVAEHGSADMTLRGLAAAINTSHRMLIYHFGSKEGLLVEVVGAVEERQRAALAELATTNAGTLADLTREFSRRLADPALWPNERLFFEMYGQALQGRPGTAALLENAIEPWLAQADEMLRQHGFDPAAARAHARLSLAVSRGLLLDLLTTHDMAGVEEAMEYFISLWEQRADPRTSARSGSGS